MTGLTSLLFVYGTLRQEARRSRFGLLGAKARFIGRARTRGRLFDLGEYPGLIAASHPDDWVRGEVYALSDPAGTLARLDAYEGPAFGRSCAEVVLDGGQQLGAWVYMYAGTIPRGRMIASGDYLDPDETP